MGLNGMVKFGWFSSLGVVEMEWAVQRGPRENGFAFTLGFARVEAEGARELASCLARLV